MSTGAWIALVAVAVAVGFGLWRQVSDGRFRGTRAVRRPGAGVDADAAEADVVDAPAPPPGVELVTAVGATLGERATLVQFSSAFCAPCRATRRVLGEVTGLVEGVVHVEVDAEHHLDATRAFGILRTPTTLVLDASGAEVARATGAPSRDQVLATLANIRSHHVDGMTT